jgi:hypothetical protein
LVIYLILDSIPLYSFAQQIANDRIVSRHSRTKQHLWSTCCGSRGRPRWRNSLGYGVFLSLPRPVRGRGTRRKYTTKRCCARFRRHSRRTRGLIWHRHGGRGLSSSSRNKRRGLCLWLCGGVYRWWWRWWSWIAVCGDGDGGQE